MELDLWIKLLIYVSCLIVPSSFSHVCTIWARLNETWPSALGRLPTGSAWDLYRVTERGGPIQSFVFPLTCNRPNTIFEDIFTKRNPQLARMLVGGQHQQITYREFFPVVLGEKALGNLVESETTYDQIVDPSILNEFATVAFRWNFGIHFKCQYQYQYLWYLFARAGLIIDNDFQSFRSFNLKGPFFE